MLPHQTCSLAGRVFICSLFFFQGIGQILAPPQSFASWVLFLLCPASTELALGLPTQEFAPKTCLKIGGVQGTASFRWCVLTEC